MKRDLEKVFQDCKMVAVVQNNGSNAEDMMILRHRLYKHGITVRFFPNQVKSIYVYFCGTKHVDCDCEFMQATLLPFHLQLILFLNTFLFDSRQ